MLEPLDVRLTPEIAVCCYTALLTDTGRFQYQNTTSAALRDAAEMLDAGVDPADVALRVYQSRSPGSLALEARAMSRLTLANDGRVAYTWLTDADFVETGALPEEGEFLPDAIRVLDDIDVAMVLRQRGDEVRVNLRAKTGFDVGSVARGFGGGGHHAAAGLTWERPGIQEFLDQILPSLPGGVARR
jgi:phosphoesterase RecJ-like protein